MPTDEDKFNRVLLLLEEMIIKGHLTRAKNDWYVQAQFWEGGNLDLQGKINVAGGLFAMSQPCSEIWINNQHGETMASFSKADGLIEFKD